MRFLQFSNDYTFLNLHLTLIPALNRGGYIRGDKAYDSNPLHEVALHIGHQLVAERIRPRTNLGHRQHSPGRLRSIALLQNKFGKALYHCRDDIDRCFSWLTIGKSEHEKYSHV
jgi:hypothetical protein